MSKKILFQVQSCANSTYKVAPSFLLIRNGKLGI